jgi:hypothetical protein
VFFVPRTKSAELDAIMIAGAGAAYFNGGFGIWEFGFTTIVTYLAYRVLRSYNFIGIDWLFHTGWNVLHHLYPIVPRAPHLPRDDGRRSGCCICLSQNAQAGAASPGQYRAADVLQAMPAKARQWKSELMQANYLFMKVTSPAPCHNNVAVTSAANSIPEVLFRGHLSGGREPRKIQI